MGKSKANMTYIYNKYISPRKTISNALTSIYGIGLKRALAVCNALCINPKKRFYELSVLHVSDAQKRMATAQKVGSLLRKEVSESIQKYIKIRSYRGLRHKNRLPVRGQRTHTNAQTQKKKQMRDF